MSEYSSSEDIDEYNENQLNEDTRLERCQTERTINDIMTQALAWSSSFNYK